MDFADTDVSAVVKHKIDLQIEPDETLKLTHDPDGMGIYSLKATKFSNLKHLNIYIKSNFGGETTRLHYIGLHGDFMAPAREEIVIANYELKPNVCDHEVDAFQQVPRFAH